MNKKILYLAFSLLVIWGLYFLFSPQTQTKVPVIDDQQVSNKQVIVSDPITAESEESDLIKTGNIEFNGVLEGFVDGKDEFLGSYKYALIHDDSELLSIDLRPLVGYDVTNLEEDLGVKVGNVVVLRGRMEDGEFVITELRSEQ